MKNPKRICANWNGRSRIYASAIKAIFAHSYLKSDLHACFALFLGLADSFSRRTNSVLLIFHGVPLTLLLIVAAINILCNFFFFCLIP